MKLLGATRIPTHGAKRPAAISLDDGEQLLHDPNVRIGEVTQESMYVIGIVNHVGAQAVCPAQAGEDVRWWKDARRSKILVVTIRRQSFA